MANELRVFENEMFGQVRTVEVDGEPWFVASDICKALDLSNATVSVQRLDDDEKSKFNLGLSGGATNCVNEYGLYSLVLASRKPEAKTFKRWITHEVIPALRKTGGYVSNSDLFVDTYFSDVPYAQRELVRGLVMNIEAQQKTINEMKPKALFHDAVALTKNAVSIGDLSKILKQNGIDIGRNRLFNWLRDNGYLMKHGYLGNNMPTQKAMERKLFRVKQYVATDSMGLKETRYITLVTPKGQQYFVDKFLSNNLEEAV